MGSKPPAPGRASAQIIGKFNIKPTDTKAKLGPGDRIIVLKRSAAAAVKKLNPKNLIASPRAWAGLAGYQHLAYPGADGH